MRHKRDGLLLGAAALVGAALVAGMVLAASAASFAMYAMVAIAGAVGMWWGSNTFSHIHLHTPLFRSRIANGGLSLGFTLLLGVPQSWWRHRHLAHHAGLSPAPAPRPPVLRATLGEAALLGVLWATLAVAAPLAFLGAYLPGFLLGLGLCALQGHYEHARGAAGVDHQGWLYNLLWFNDGYHAAHHVRPSAHWSTLGPVADAARPSRFPPALRWLESVGALANLLAAFFIARLERHTTGSAAVRRFLLRTHRRALARLLAQARPQPTIRALVVGGGLFPRTALLLRELLPDATVTIVEENPVHIAIARRFLLQAGVPESTVRFVTGRFPDVPGEFDLVIVPLGFRGDREALYAAPPAPIMLIHDWLWHRRGAAGALVSPWLAKRVNLVQGSPGWTASLEARRSSQSRVLALRPACSTVLPAATRTPF